MTGGATFTGFVPGSKQLEVRDEPDQGAAQLIARAKAKGVDVGQLVNELLKKNIELIESAR